MTVCLWSGVLIRFLQPEASEDRKAKSADCKFTCRTGSSESPDLTRGSPRHNLKAGREAEICHIGKKNLFADKC